MEKFFLPSSLSAVCLNSLLLLPEIATMARIRVTGDGDGKAKKGGFVYLLDCSTCHSIFSGEMKVGGEKKKRGTLSDHADILFPAQRILRKSFVARPPLVSFHFQVR